MVPALISASCCMFWCSLVLAAFCFVRSAADDDGHGWSMEGVEQYLITETCNIDRIPLTAIKENQFKAMYLEERPVILVGSNNRRFRNMTSKGLLLKEFGDTIVTLSSANTVSHDKIPQLLRDYIQGMVPQTLNQLGNETFYLFGPDKEIAEELGPLLSTYNRPAFSGDDLAFSFGIGPSGSGVPFHVHGHGFSEVLHGKKRWFLYPPDHKPPFHPDELSAAWLKNIYPTLEGDDKTNLQECIIESGEVLYFPSMWWHAIVNIGESVFMSSFDGRQINHKKNMHRKLPDPSKTRRAPIAFESSAREL